MSIEELLKDEDIVPLSAGDDDYLFTVMQGPYAGITYTYSDLDFDENEDGTTALSFSYQIFDNQFNVEVDQGFEQKIGEYMVEVIEWILERSQEIGEE